MHIGIHLYNTNKTIIPLSNYIFGVLEKSSIDPNNRNSQIIYAQQWGQGGGPQILFVEYTPAEYSPTYFIGIIFISHKGLVRASLEREF